MPRPLLASLPPALLTAAALFAAGCITVHTDAPTTTPPAAGESSSTTIRIEGSGVRFSSNNNNNDGNGNSNGNGNGSWSSHSWMSVTRNGVTTVYGDKPEPRTFSQSIPAAGVRTVSVSSDYGAIAVAPAADAARITVEATVTLSDNNLSKADRQKYLSGFTIPAAPNTGGALDAGVVPPAKLPHGVGYVASYRLRVPPAVALSLESENGAVSVHDTHTRGAIRARSGYGAITITDAGTTIDAESGNGAVSVTGGAADSVRAKSSYGAVSVAVAARTIDARSQNGAVTVRGAAQAARVTAESGYGKVSLSDVGGTVIARSGNGAVTYAGSPVSLALRSGYGAVSATLRDCDALTDATIESENGAVKAAVPAGASLSITGRSRSGGISADGFLSTVRTSGNSGTVTGTMNGGRAPLRLSSGYGSVSISAR